MSDPYREDQLGRPPDLGLVRRLWPFVRPYRRAFAVSLLLLLLSFGIELLGPYLVKLTIDGPLSDTTASSEERRAELWRLLGAFAATIGVGSLLGYVYGRLTAWNGQRVVRDVRRHLIDHVLHAPQSFHDANPAGKLTTRVTSDVESLNELISTGVLQSAFDLLKIIGVLVAMFVLDLWLAIFTVATVPVVILISVMTRRNAQRAYRAVRGKLALQNAYTTEAVGGIRATRAFQREAHTERHYAKRNAETAAAWRQTVLHFSVFFALVDLALRLSTIGLLWFGGSAVLRGDALVGEFVQFWLYFGMLTRPIKDLGEKYQVLQAAFAAAERIFLILGEPTFPPPRPADAGPPYEPDSRQPMPVRFENVMFRYRDELPLVLDDVSFDAPAGSTIAIVGPTGAGKTTTLTLISRLRDTTAGRVLVDDVDVRDWDLEALRQRIGVVAQDLFLFTGTVLDNIRLFDRSIGEDEVRAALELVGAMDFVERLDGGLHARVEERGATFSQGQRQLLAFARALASNPAVLLLDEATASIDSESEQRLQNALASALRGRTALVVAHRLSTVRAADRILVLDDHRIREAGTHEELALRGGIYAEMLRRARAESS